MEDIGKYKYSAILISDMAGFSEFSRNMTARKLYEHLYSFFEMMGSVIKKRDGRLVKTLGDGLLSYFPSSDDDILAKSDAVYNCVKAAIDMKIVNSFLNHCNIILENSSNRAEIDLRIAINAGVIRIGPILPEEGETEDVVGTHVNLTSRVEGILSKLKSTGLNTEPIVMTDMARERVKDKVIFFPNEVIKRIRGFGSFQLILSEVICIKDDHVAFSKSVTSKEGHRTRTDEYDEFYKQKTKEPVYGPFESQEQPQEDIYADYRIDLQEYENSRNVLIQLPLLASEKGRKGESEKWRNLYFIKNGEDYVQIAESSGVTFSELKPFEYAPCIDLKDLEKRKKFSKEALMQDKLRLFMTQWNDGEDSFYIQPRNSRRWRRVYLGVVYIMKISQP